MADTVPLHISAGEPRPGIWCDRCLTSAAVTVPLYVMDSSGFTLAGEITGCSWCDASEEGGEHMETINEEATPVQIGDPVVVVDEQYGRHVGLVTTVHGEFGGAYTPSINVVYVTGDPAKRDPYGAQVERLSSLQHYSAGPNGMPKPGRFWSNL